MLLPLPASTSALYYHATPTLALTTTESTNSNTSATTTESTNSNTNATTTESTNSSTSATTKTDSNTSATTTASTNSSTNATTTESTNALVPRRTPIKMAMLRIIDSIQSPTLTKSRISGKGVKWFC
nr:ADM_HP1_G0050210.mRNA.1.CDS.1 [Saccharomyces cerevisiae]